jgi:hypothetical protein
MSDLVHSVTTDPNVLSLVAEHTSTMSDLVHSVTTNPNVLSLVADSLHTNFWEESPTLLIDHLSVDTHDVNYHSGATIENGHDVQMKEVHDKVNNLYGKTHNSQLHTTDEQWRNSDELVKKKLSVDYQMGRKLDLSKMLTGNCNVKAGPSASILETMLGNFKEIYQVEPFLAYECIVEIPEHDLRSSFMSHVVGKLADGNRIAMSLGLT